MREIERAASAHLGRPWVARGFTDLNDRASHPCAVLHGRALSVFAKLNVASDADEQFTAELHGLRVLKRRARVAIPTPIAEGVVVVDAGSLLLFEALRERPTEARSTGDWRSIGHTLAAMHAVHNDQFGLPQLDGFFGPLRQDNRPVPSNRWADFYAERRITPYLRSAIDSGNLPVGLSADVERLVRRLPALCGPEPQPCLLHGDAQQNNFVSSPAGAVVIDPAPYFGHPEIDLALVDYFQPVPDDVSQAYRDVASIDAGFAQRRELWRLFAYLAVIAVDAASSIAGRFVGRLADAVRLYR